MTIGTMTQDNQLKRATEQIHVAAQYLAMFGKYFVPKKEDDSHTNFEWDLLSRQFISHPASFTPIRMFLRPEDLKLGLGSHADDLVAELRLPGLTKEEGTEWVKAQLRHLDFDANVYQISLHYDLPAYGNPGLRPFELADPHSFNQFRDLRGWAKEIIDHYKKAFALAQADCTWPHHFDHGCYVPLTIDSNGKVAGSISFGLAIHDVLQDSHYLYVTHWTAEILNDLDPPKLSSGRWELDRMQGTLLPITQKGDFDTNTQVDRAHLFMREAIDASLNFLKRPSKEF